MDINEKIQFIIRKHYIFQEDIGQGGTGKTILIKDELLDEVFVCKKYSPYNIEDKETYFKYFIDEIKLLHKVYHKNIVRVFNYYLYPERVTGYIIMEFIKGQRIDEYIYGNPDKLNDIFVQTIQGFAYLEEVKILHRDIRPENILVTYEGVCKIIDFGFSKAINFGNSDNSISLNWRYSKPDEFNEGIYDTRTEIYFVGKLFKEIVGQFKNIDFRYKSALTNMVTVYSERTSSFFEVYRELVDRFKSNINITTAEQRVYRDFANNLMLLISEISYTAKYKKDIEQIIKSLDEVYHMSLLEEYIHNNRKLTDVFLEGSYVYYPEKRFEVGVLSAMINLLKSSSDDRQKVILNNLWERFDGVARYNEEANDDLPF